MSSVPPITSFKGEYHFLSNFFPCSIYFRGRWYPTSEHAFIAAKTTDDQIRAYISTIETPGKAKRYGRTIELRSNWEQVKLLFMREILELKFSPFRSDIPLYSMLRATAPAVLIEGNNHKDRFWGQCPLGTGQNHLGKILMSLRDDITMLWAS